MGKVFPYEDILDKYVPDREHFLHVGRCIKKKMQSPETNWLVAASFLGSFAAGSFSSRSDIDCVLIYESGRQLECNRFLQEYNWLAKTNHVPLEFLDLDSESALSGQHTLHCSILDHIAIYAKKEGSIKGDVISAIARTGKTAREEAIDYATHKIRKFSKIWGKIPMLSSDEYHLLLSKVLDFPMHMARKTCAAKGIDFGDSDSKERVIKEYYAVARGEFYDLYRGLMDSYHLNLMYSRELKNQLIKPCKSSYKDMLGHIELAIPNVLNFARGNLKLLQA